MYPHFHFSAGPPSQIELWSTPLSLLGCSVWPARWRSTSPFVPSRRLRRPALRFHPQKARARRRRPDVPSHSRERVPLLPARWIANRTVPWLPSLLLHRPRELDLSPAIHLRSSLTAMRSSTRPRGRSKGEAASTQSLATRGLSPARPPHPTHKPAKLTAA